MTVEVDLNLGSFSEDDFLEFLEELEQDYNHNNRVVAGGITTCRYTIKNAHVRRDAVREFAFRVLGINVPKDLTMNQASALEFFLENIDSITEDKLKTL